MHAVIVSFRTCSDRLSLPEQPCRHIPSLASIPGLEESRVLVNGTRNALFLLFRNVQFAEACLSSNAFKNLIGDATLRDIFIDHYDALESMPDRRPEQIAGDLLVEEVAVASIH